MINKNKFSKIVEETVSTTTLSYIDAIVYVCENNSIEIDDCKKFISASIQEKLENEARKLNYLPRKKNKGLFDAV